MKASDRPWILEVLEPNPHADGRVEWRTWSTTVQEPGAVRIRDILLAKGRTVRVRNQDTGVITVVRPLSCSHCDERHLPPYDGSCLL